MKMSLILPLATDDGLHIPCTVIIVDIPCSSSFPRRVLLIVEFLIPPVEFISIDFILKQEVPTWQQFSQGVIWTTVGRLPNITNEYNISKSSQVM